MSIVRVGTSKKYADNYDKIFGKKKATKKTSAKKKKATKKSKK